MTTVYKVVIEEDGKWLSAVMFSEPVLCVRYKVGEFVAPSIGKILAFDSLEHAASFLHREGGVNLHIFESEADDVSVQDIVANPASSTEDILLFWNAPGRGNPRMSNVASPHGTVSCSRLKLVKECNDY